MILASDQDDTFYAELARRLTYSEAERVTGGSGLIVVQIDGLAAPILRNAIRVGITPEDGQLGPLRAVPPGRVGVRAAVPDLGEPGGDPPRQQRQHPGLPLVREGDRAPAGLEPPGGRDRDRAPGLERARACWRPAGPAWATCSAGDATRTLFTMSRMGPEDAADVSAFSLYFVDPAAFIRTVVLTITEVVKERLEARRQVASDIQPRVHRGATFAVLRAVSNVVLRDLNVTFVMDAMRRGTPIVYVDMVDYDELAHHAGPERLETLRSLAGVDRVLGSLRRAAASAPRDYRIVVVSDHGQSQGATFKDRYGATLAEVIEGLMGAGTATSASTGVAEQGEGWGPVNALLSEIRSRPGVAGRVAVIRAREPHRGRRGRHRREEGRQGAGARRCDRHGPRQRQPGQRLLHRARGPGEPRAARGDRTPDCSQAWLRTRASGSSSSGPRPWAPWRWVRPVPATSTTTGWRAWIRWRSSVPTPRTTCCAWTGSPTWATCSINSSYDAELEEVAAFEELVGSHGGFGGPQTRPFLLAPVELEFTDEPIVGAPAVYRQLVRWADALGVGPESGAGDSPVVQDRHLPEPKGIRWVAALLVFASVPAILFAGAVLILEIVSADVKRWRPRRSWSSC